MSQGQEPAAQYTRRKSIPSEAPGLFGPTPPKGVVTAPERSPAQMDPPAVYYAHPHGQIWLGDAVAGLRSLPPVRL